MGIDEVWRSLTPETRDWLIANNGDAVPADIAAEIDDVIDATGEDGVWAVEKPDASAAVDDDPDDKDDDDEDYGGRYLSDEAVDWIETVANEE